MPSIACGNNITVRSRRTSNRFHTKLKSCLNVFFFRIQTIALSRLMSVLITVSDISILAIRVFVIAMADCNKKPWQLYDQ